jgi:single-strand DNA-binding protein
MIGRATADAKVKQVSESSQVATFRIVSNKQIKKRDGTKDEKSTFIDVEVWGQRAEYAGNYIKRGTPVLVRGELETDEWEKDGQKRSKIKIYGVSVQALRTDAKTDATADGDGAQAPKKEAVAAAAGGDDDPPF